jgi:hypothetical protein
MGPSRARLVGFGATIFCLAATAVIIIRAATDFGSADLQEDFGIYGFIAVLLVGSVAPAVRAYTDKPNRT